MFRIIFTTTILSFASAPAFAQIADPMPSDTAGTGYIGATALLSSDYLGAANETVTALPYLSFENIKGFDLFGTALSYRAIEAGTGEGFGKWSLRAGPTVSYQRGRDSSDSVNLIGFDDVDASILAGGYIRTTIGPVGLRLDAAQDFAGGHDGLTVDASIGTFYRVGNFAIQPSATVSWGSGAHNDSFFSVTNAQAASSGLTTYDAGAGIYGYSLGIVSWVEIKDQYAISLIGSYRWFTDEAEDSPILNASDGSKNGLFAGLSVSRKFDSNKW
ncbi:MipA/OmpV family protein [Fretibacter rubidus]|uniref:MipA/OmpV family protein n=1 Tax=Fretibacter rubidus TaxID=570162 RepID=UPI00352A2436